MGLKRWHRWGVDQELERLRELFEAIDRETAAFAGLSGLACPAGCGACCLSPEVETTELEMRVMADHLWNCGAAEAVLERLEAADAPGSCVLYQPETGNARRGRCGHYAQRPTLCRLFAFAAVRDKAGGNRLAACRVHREADPAGVARAEEAVAAGRWTAPLFSRVAEALWDIDPELGSVRRPINEALRRALHREGWRRRGTEAENAAG